MCILKTKTTITYKYEMTKSKKMASLRKRLYKAIDDAKSLEQEWGTKKIVQSCHYHYRYVPPKPGAPQSEWCSMMAWPEVWRPVRL